MHKLKWFLFALLFSFQLPAYAALNLTLTQGVAGAIPITIVPFDGDTGNVSQVITNDLNDSGKFKSVELSEKPSDIVKGQISWDGFGKYKIHFQLLNAYKNNAPLLDQQMVVSKNQLRAAAHHISDLIFQTLTGVRGIFSTRIAYVLVQGNKYSLDVADYDGYNPQPILISHSPIMSPAWSHSGRKIAYVSFENNNHPEIYISNVATGARQLVSAYHGINSAPAFSPNDNRLALVLSREGNAQIFVMNLATKQLQQITTGNAINTEPSFAPDGQSLLFTSDRGGSPQIYRYVFSSGQIERMSYNGHYNARASFSPSGNQIVMIHAGSNTNGYGIGLQDLQTGAYLTLDNSGNDQSPSFAPNGQMVIFAMKTGLRRQLALISTDGRIKLALPSDVGEVQEPVWSPFLH